MTTFAVSRAPLYCTFTALTAAGLLLASLVVGAVVVNDRTCRSARADDGPATNAAESNEVAPESDPAAGPSQEEIRAAAKKALPLLVAGAEGSLAQRKQCFTCHNQGLPIMALVAARSRGIAIDEEHLRRQLQFIRDFLAKNRDRYLEGRGQGGQADTAGYALWTLDNGGWRPEDDTAAVAEYFLIYQQDRDHWQSVSRRPPSEQSPFTTSYVSLRGLNVYGTPEQQERIDARMQQVGRWLLTTEPQDTEDHVFRLRALQLLAERWPVAVEKQNAPDSLPQSDAEVKSVDAASDDPDRPNCDSARADLARRLARATVTAREALLTLQRADGGWAQTPEMSSDAYATATALVALHEAGRLPTDAAAYLRGLRYLISIQQDDGSWHVASRSKPFQSYFESGYPHGKDQFISIAAGGWATTALLLALPERTRGDAAGEDAAADMPTADAASAANVDQP